MLRNDSVAASGNLPSPSPHDDFYCKYVAIRVNDISGVALVDSGNTWRTVISPAFATQLGINLTTDLRPLSISRIGTAKQGSSMQVLGETSRHIHIMLGDCPTKFKIRPVVVQGLSMPMNLSGPFLKRHNIDQLHSQNSLCLQGRLIPLLSQVSDPLLTECSTSALYLNESVTIPACSVTHTLVNAPQILSGRMPSTEGAVTGSLQFMHNYNAHPWLNSIVVPNEHGQLRVGIMNTLGEPITIPAKTYYGSFQLTCDSSHQNRFPWRLATINSATTVTETFRPTDLAAPSLPDSSPALPPFMAGPTTKQNYLPRLNYFITTFHLDKSPALNSSQLQLRAAELLLKYFDVFSFDGGFGSTSLLQHQIYTDDGPPINQRYRPVNPSLEPQLKQQLGDWLEHDVIEHSTSPWNFGLVSVRKKNGKVRWCVDFRELNKRSKRDTFPIGCIEDNLVRLSSSTIFSGLDASGAFHVVPLEESSKEKTAFATPFGSYQFKRLPFGLANGPSTYARLVKMVLQGIPTSVALPYLDDVIIHSPTVPSHFDALESVLSAYRKAGLKLQPAKCQLFQTQIDYLGHTVSEKGIAPLAAYTDLVKKWPLPNTRQATRAFLGKIGYYRRFIKGFAGLAKPLTDKLGADGTLDKETFVPSTDFKTSFLTLRKALTTAPILAYPQFHSDQPFILDTDWSQTNSAIGGVLSQKQDGLERVIAYGAHKLVAGQRNYPPTKGELFAIIYFTSYWRYYLQHRPFLIRTDHMSLKFLYNMEAPQGMVARWLHLLSSFQFTIQYRPGRSHGNADALSRLPDITQDSSSLFAKPNLPMDEQIMHLHGSIDEVRKNTKLHANSPVTQHSSMLTNVILAPELLPTNLSISQVTNDSNHFWSPDYLLKHQKHDPDINFLPELIAGSAHTRDTFYRTKYKSLSPIGKIYFGLISSLTVDRFKLIRYNLPARHSTLRSSRQVLVLPFLLIQPAVMRAHKQVAHMSSMATFNKLKMYCFFPNMMRHIKNILMTCGPCQTKTTRLPDQRHTLHSHQPGYPFQVLSMDFVGPFPVSNPHRYQYLLTIRDTFTRWVEAFPLRHATAINVVTILQNEIFARYGKCERLHSDRGSQFTGDMLAQMGSLLNIKISQTPAYNPKSNSVERMHRDLKSALQALASQKPSTWADFIPSILFAFRSSVSSATGFSPFQLMFGRDPIEDLDAILPNPTHGLKLLQAPDYFQTLTTRLTQAYHLARDNMALAVSRQRRNYARRSDVFEPSTLVWLFTPILPDRKLPKFRSGWSGPWIVKELINNLTYRIQLKANPHKLEVVSIDRLRKYFDDTSDLPIPPPPGDLSMPGDEFCEYCPYYVSTPASSASSDNSYPLLSSPSHSLSLTPSSSQTSPNGSATSPSIPSSPEPPAPSPIQSSAPSSPSSPHPPRFHQPVHLPWDTRSIADWDDDFSPSRQSSPNVSLSTEDSNITLPPNTAAQAPPSQPTAFDAAYARYAPDPTVQQNRRDRYLRRNQASVAVSPPVQESQEQTPVAPPCTDSPPDSSFESAREDSANTEPSVSIDIIN